MEPTSTSSVDNGTTEGFGRSDIHSYPSKEADNVPASHSGSLRGSGDSVIVTRTIEQKIDNKDSGNPRHERPAKKNCDVLNHKAKFFMIISAAIVLVGFGAAYLAGLFQRKLPFISLANSLDKIGSGLERIDSTPNIVSTTVTEKVTAQAAVTVPALTDIPSMVHPATKVAIPSVQTKEVVQTETVWMNGRRGMPLEAVGSLSPSGILTEYKNITHGTETTVSATSTSTSIVTVTAAEPTTSSAFPHWNNSTSSHSACSTSITSASSTNRTSTSLHWTSSTSAHPINSTTSTAPLWSNTAGLTSTRATNSTHSTSSTPLPWTNTTTSACGILFSTVTVSVTVTPTPWPALSSTTAGTDALSTNPPSSRALTTTLTPSYPAPYTPSASSSYTTNTTTRSLHNSTRTRTIITGITPTHSRTIITGLTSTSTRTVTTGVTTLTTTTFLPTGTDTTTTTTTTIYPHHASSPFLNNTSSTTTTTVTMWGTGGGVNSTYVFPTASYTPARSGAESSKVVVVLGGGRKNTKGGGGGGAFSYCVVMAVAVALWGV